MEPNRNSSAAAARPVETGAVLRAHSFDSTPWSVVLRARDCNAPEARAALATLCQTYWYPMYAYIRRRSATAEDAEDFTQEFFTRLLEKGFGNEVDQAKGAFRTYLLACCKHFLANTRRAARAGKRGGGQTILSLDVEAANRNYLREPAEAIDAEKLFDRRWALTLLERSLDQLGEEYRQQGKESLHTELKHCLVGDAGAGSYAEVADRLGMTEDAVKKAAQRLRQRCGVIVRKFIRATVDRPEDVEVEIRALFAVLSG